MARFTRKQKIERVSEYARQIIENRSNGARGKPDVNHSPNWLLNQIKGTDLGLSRQTVNDIYNFQLKNFRSLKFSPQIQYDKLQSSKHRIIKNYSFVVQRGYLIDENGNYVRDNKGKRIGNYVTIATDEKLSRAEIKKKAMSIPPSSDCQSLGYSIKQHIVIKRMIKNN